jgi:3-methyladenine DNA glycosylase/8-oxoguanine DNA glycosylase
VAVVGSDLFPAPVTGPADLDLVATVGGHATGRGDPTTIVAGHEVWRAARTPDGPGTLHVARPGGGGEFTVRTWGPGGPWLRQRVPALLGLHDRPDALVAQDPVVAEAHHRHPGLRIGRTDQVLHALLPAILEQRVTGLEARRSYLGICRALGTPAPGPARLLLPPDPTDLAARPYWWYHRFGVDRRRAETIRFAARRADRLEEVATLPLPLAYERLGAVPGVGPWTVATVAGSALGDPDAVVVGDYHLPHLVSFALAGERRATDQRMVELLEPYRGQRGRVVRLLVLSGLGPPRRAPRQRILPMASM